MDNRHRAPPHNRSLPSIQIRPATLGDASLLRLLVCKFAEHENLRHELESTPNAFACHILGKAPMAFTLLVYFRGIPAGFAVWHLIYLTLRKELLPAT